jgi:plastocyanin
MLTRLASGAAAVTLLLVLGGCAENDNGNNTLVGQSESPSASPTAPGHPASTAAAPQGGAIALVAKDMEFAPKEVEAKAGTVSIEMKNTGAAPHTFTSTELHVDQNADAGKTVTFTLDGVKPGTYKFICKYHESIGMVGELKVT